jgi:DNA-binding XRE family transcriptional regulator
MNIPKLKGKMVEMGYNVETFATQIGVDRSTLYRKLECGEKISIGEAQRMKDVLSLSNEEVSAIFFN